MTGNGGCAKGPNVCRSPTHCRQSGRVDVRFKGGEHEAGKGGFRGAQNPASVDVTGDVVIRVLLAEDVRLGEPDPAEPERVGGLRANASTLSHTELDDAETLDSGDRTDLAERSSELRQVLPTLRVLGGCCGTDHRHIDAVSRHCVSRTW